jgi:hypothetical protein
MNAVAWWSAVAILFAVLCGAWHNMVSRRCLRGKRAIYAPVLYFASAVGLPLATLFLARTAGPWIWLLVALGANGLLMLGVDSLLSGQ